MATDAGWVWHDFEDTCTGPVAWDLAASTASPRLDGPRILAAYGEVPSPARGLPAAEEVAPDRLVQPLCRTVAGSRLPRRRTAHPVAGALTPDP